MPYYQDFREFKTRQDCEFELLDDKMYFQNGAMSDGHWMHVEPPTDPKLLLENRRMFLKARLDRLIRSYKADKNALTTQIQFHSYGAGPAPDPRWQPDLEKMAQQITALENEFNELTAQTSQSQGTNTYEERRHQERQEALRAAACVNALPNFNSPLKPKLVDLGRL